MQRHARLVHDLQRLEELRRESSIFDFEASGDPPDRYTLSFRGRGVTRKLAAGELEPIELHRCDLRLLWSYPDHPPDIRWLTPLFHPNVSFSGLISLQEIGVPWDPGLGLDAICERLWDLARLAYFDLDRPRNDAAKCWLEESPELQLPIDPRPLRDRAARSSVNIVRYSRREPSRQLHFQSPRSKEVLYIGEDTPIPDLPAPRPRPAGGEDVLYIGPE